MPIIRVHRYARADLRANHPWRLYVFGDNLAQTGYGGQARECRDEPNAVGIPTKVAPSMAAGAFLTDDHLDTVRPIYQSVFRRLDEHLSNGGTVVWPMDGIGTGLAKLESGAPTIWAYLQSCIDELERREATRLNTR